MKCNHTKSATFFLMAFIISIALLPSCTGSSTSASQLSEKLEVKWELISTDVEKGATSASFTFINKGSNAIDNKSWIMYFNQSNIQPVNLADSAIGKVEHVNGDFFRFVPGVQFNLQPGDSLKVVYAYENIMIKYGDAPAGVYVAKDEKGKQLAASVKNFSIVPFENNIRLFNDSIFLSTLPTPKNNYVRNLAVDTLAFQQLCPIIPTPMKFTKGNGSVEITTATLICFEKGLDNEADLLLTTLEKQTGIKLQKQEGIDEKNARTISLKLTNMPANAGTAEGYLLSVTPNKGIAISGNDAAGVFYGIQSLMALFPTNAYAKKGSPINISAGEIADAPRFHYRGFLLDVARNFQSKEAVYKLIDLLAFYKINTIDIRLTEDEGWRLEINGLPELTQVGAKRGHTIDDADFLQPSFGSGPFSDSKGNTGTGYYSRNDFKEILSYAAKRHIKIIPEICFPSHTRAAIKSMEARYRYYMQKGNKSAAEEYRLADPEDKSVYLSAQSFKDNISNVALPSTYNFYHAVIKDIAAMYQEAGLQLNMLHTGGDEVPQGAWEKSPASVNLMKTLPGITNARNLQGYFFKRILDSLSKYKLQIGGWEEVVLNKDSKGKATINNEFVGKNVIPYVWDNTGENIDLGYRIANAGYPVVLCNSTNLYFDLSYNTDPTEPGLYWSGFQDAKDPFVLAPYDAFKSKIYNDYGNIVPVDESAFNNFERLKPENKKNILGLQAQLWTETVKGQNMMEYYVLPKLFAFAEKAWAAAPAWESEANQQKRIQQIESGWSSFANRIGQYEFPRLDYIFGGYNYRISPPGAIIENGLLKANIAFPGLIIRYTTDGSEPGNNSAIYTMPVAVNGTIKLKAFSQSGRGGKTIEVD